jgi:hypothetical protein
VILLSAFIVSAALVWAALQIVSEMRSARSGSGGHDRTMSLLALFAPAVASAQQDPRALLAWQPIARAARQLFPEDFAALDRAVAGTFPFSHDRIEAAHAQWTADWLGWELAHDTEYKLKAAVAEHELAGKDAGGLVRTKLDAIEREKLGLYQRRYAEYVQTAKALQALLTS